MFNDNITRRLMSIENEQRSQKVAAPLNYGQLAQGSLPTAVWNGFISQYLAPGKTVTAEWEIVFQRSDGVKKPPLVQLSYDHDQDIHPFTATLELNRWLDRQDRILDHLRTLA